MPSPKIAIIGAGPAGCMLARLLTLADVPVTIFEGEATLDVRSQGGTLDLHFDTGLAAITEAGLWDEFRKHARYDGEALSLYDKNFRRWIHLEGGKTKDSPGAWDRPEIDRHQLRALLLRSLPEGVIRWSHRLRRIDEDLNLHFDQGVETGYDLVIGADGAWSRVRPLVSDDKPFYSGIAGCSLKISDVEKSYPEVYKLINRGSVFSFSDGKAIMGQYMGDGSIHVTTWAVRGEDWMKESGYDVNDADATKKAIRDEFHDWSDELVSITQKTDGNVTPMSLYMLPVGNRWAHRRGITLVGDAAHLMTPFAGEGVNTALDDSLRLAKAIIGAAKEGGSLDALDKNVRAFEEDMFVRAEKVQAQTYQNLRSRFYTEGSPGKDIEPFVLGAASGSLPSWCYPVAYPALALAVYGYYFLFRLLGWGYEKA